MTKKLKVYTLFQDSDGSPTCMSVAYSRGPKRFWHVAAKSIKQAYWLVANQQWWDRHVGILETYNGYSGRWENHLGEFWYGNGRFEDMKYTTREHVSAILDQPVA